jgi:signal transduction histidine kinase
VRSRLITVAGATTLMVVLAFVVPLALLVRDLASDRALIAAEREAEGIARFLAVVAPARGIDGAVLSLGVEVEGTGEVSIVLPNGDVIGRPLDAGEDLSPAAEGAAFRAPVAGGQAVYVPVVLGDGSVGVIRVFVPDEEMKEGVAQSWITLALLGALLILVAVLLADRLGRSVVVPVADLAAATSRLGQGDLEARVTPAGPEEIREVGTEFNRLAGRIERMVGEAYEASADLSHRLRTPLTVVRLDAEGLPAGSEKDRLLDDLAELERMTDFVIHEARRPVVQGTGETAELVAVAADRVEYWSALAEEQGRPLELLSDPGPMFVPGAVADLAVLFDSLIGNAFAHTDDGVAIRVAVRNRDSLVLVFVEDAGSGIPDRSLVDRGASGAGSTGLGLDIVRRTAEAAGGSMTIGTSDVLGGAAVVVRLPRAR